MTRDTPHILLVNPWIHDFAAYDFWAKPAGLLQLAAILKQHGCRISYVDCLNRFHPRGPAADPHARFGRGPYLKTPLSRPPKLPDIPRRYSRYGIKKNWFLQDLHALASPDLILVTSMMAYWYPGVQETIAALKCAWPGVPVVLGGIYATLWPEHASAASGADHVVTGAGEDTILSLVERMTAMPMGPASEVSDLDSGPYPAYHLQGVLGYVPLLTSKGCPFRCAYCAASVLNPVWMRRSPDAVVEEICYWYRAYRVKDFVFYDDALMVDARRHLGPLLETVLMKALPVRFHTPNALHLNAIDRNMAHLMARAGFTTIRLGVETARFDEQRRIDCKLKFHEFADGANALKQAGFKRDQLGAYLLVGLPGQTLSEVRRSIRVVKQYGIQPILAHYTPIPGTAMWERAKASSRYDLTSDPIFSNNSIMPCQKQPFDWRRLSALKQMALM